MLPVPSGDPSSTTSTSSFGSCFRTRSMSRAMFSRSLYVGTMTTERPTPVRVCSAAPASATAAASPVHDDSAGDQEERQHQRDEGDRLAALVRGAVEREVDVGRTGGQLDADE